MNQKNKTENSTNYYVNYLDEQIIFPVSEDTKSLQFRFWDKWERLRRHEKYLELCKEIEFHKSGLISPRWTVLNKEKFIDINKKIQDLFGVGTIFDPKKVFAELPLGAIETFGINPVAVKIMAKDISINVDVKGEDFEKRFIENDKFITVQIDITQPDVDIISLLMANINKQRKLIGLKVNGHRTNFPAWLEDYKIFDLKKMGKTNIEIIKIMWPEEYKACQEGNESKLKKIYYDLKEKYEKAGYKDWNEKAYEEAYEHNFVMRNLHQRVTDKYNGASKRIAKLIQI